MRQVHKAQVPRLAPQSTAFERQALRGYPERQFLLAKLMDKVTRLDKDIYWTQYLSAQVGPNLSETQFLLLKCAARKIPQDWQDGSVRSRCQA